MASGTLIPAQPVRRPGARVGTPLTVSITGAPSVCGETPSIYDAGPGFASYIWSLDGLPISFQQTATLGFLAAGSHSLTVRASNGACEAEASLTVSNLPPHINSIQPQSGPTTGGTPVSLSGSCFAPGASFSIGGAAATGVAFGSVSQISGTTAGHSPGTFDVVATNPDGQNATLPASYTYTCSSIPTATVSGDATVCAGTTVHLLLSLTGESPWTVNWSDGYVQTVYTNPAQRYVTPTSATTYFVTSVTSSFCTGGASGSATITLENCPSGTAAGSLIPDGRAVTGILAASGNIYTFSPSPFGFYYVVEADAPFAGQTSLPGGGPEPLLFATRSGGAPLDYAPEARSTCAPESANRLFLYASPNDVAAGPLEIHISDPVSSGYKVRVRAIETTMFAPRWSGNGYKALVDIQNTSDCIVEGYVYALDQVGYYYDDAFFFSLAPGQAFQRQISTYHGLFGSLVVFHDGPPGAITGGVYMIASGGASEASFRWPLQEVRSYGATDGK